MNLVRAEGCPPVALLEGFVLGEEPQLATHLETCARCAQHVATLREEAQAFVTARPPEVFLRQLERREASTRAPRRTLMFALGTALFAAALVVVVREALPESPRLKGPALRVFVKRGAAQPAQLSMDEALYPGDELRFGYRTSSRGAVTVFELDATESVSVVVPATRLEAGDHVLPGAISLDDVSGPEWFISVFSAEPCDVDAVKQQLKGQANRAHLVVTCGACVVDSVRGNKSGAR